MRLILVPALVAAVISVGVTLLMPRITAPASSAPVKESAYDRVMRTGVIRCGYGVWSPMVERDPNTGTLSGTWVDVTEALAKAMELRVEWTTEVNMSTYLEDMKSGKFDVECGGGWPNAIRGKYAEYTQPAFYFAVVPLVRKDDVRFDGHYERMNASDVRIVVMDGETSVLLHKNLFPEAATYAVPPSSPIADMVLSVATGKADVVFAATSELDTYLAQVPDGLKQAAGPPLMIIPQSYSVARDETRLRNMLDTAMEQLINDGTIERIVAQHEKAPGTYLRVTAPFVMPKED